MPRRSQLRDLFVLLGGLMFLLLALFVIAGLAVNIIVDNLPQEMSISIGEVFSRQYANERQKNPGEEYLESIASRLDQGRGYRVIVAEDETANALALPGDVIVVFSGLVNEVSSENEIAFVLAHEIGHLRNRDHLRGLGRMMVFVALSSATFGPDSVVTNLLAGVMTGAEMRFSQAQEMRADMVGIGLVNSLYGHVGGAYDFFERVAGWNRGGRLAHFFSTHPYPVDRLVSLREISDERGYGNEDTMPIKRFLFEPKDTKASGPDGPPGPDAR